MTFLQSLIQVKRQFQKEQELEEQSEDAELINGMEDEEEEKSTDKSNYFTLYGELFIKIFSLIALEWSYSIHLKK